jgi:hypothetical protein
MFYYSSLNDGHGEMEEKTKKNEDVTFGNYCPLPQYFTMFESPRTQNFMEGPGRTKTIDYCKKSILSSFKLF